MGDCLYKAIALRYNERKRQISICEQDQASQKLASVKIQFDKDNIFKKKKKIALTLSFEGSLCNSIFDFPGVNGVFALFLRVLGVNG